ncbi:MAG: DNA lyase [Spirochaetales bacterium]|nr:DNA lyase [Spirochaetales bacterium]
MRLWSLDPRYLDAKGIVALWREALLAQKVLAGQTKGYKNHPQLIRFRGTSDPLGAIAEYLSSVCDEADRRGYHFDRTKILPDRLGVKINVTEGQVAYEMEHLKKKLKVRDPSALEKILKLDKPVLHPLFTVVAGDVEDWEIK